MKEKDQTYDFICFTDLVYEFGSIAEKAIEAKIKRRLKYHQMGAYSQERVEYIRRLKNELHLEISRAEQSGYFRKSPSTYTALADFDVERMTMDYGKKYKEIKTDELFAMVNFAIYLYHLR